MAIAATLCLLLVAAAAAYMVAFLAARRPYRHLPTPGICLPFFGHLRALIAGPRPETMWRLFQRYSRDGLLHINVFGLNTILMGDLHTFKYVFSHPDVQNRGRQDWRSCMFAAKILTDRGQPPGPVPGLIFSQGRPWAEQRRFTLRTLRDFGFGKASMEEMIQEEVRQFLDHLLPLADQPLDVEGQLNLPILNTLCRIAMGDRFEYSDPRLQDILERLGQLGRKSCSPAAFLGITHPWLFRLWPGLLRRDLDLKLNQDILRILGQKIQEHSDTLDTDTEPRDVIDATLLEIQSTTDPASSFYGERGLLNLRSGLLDLFIAGLLPASTLTWGLLYMAREPAVQRRVQAEIARVAEGHGGGAAGTACRPLCLADRTAMPYTEAVLMEIQRCGNVVPHSLHHMSSRDLTVNGMKIPADTMFSPLMLEIQKGDHWGDGVTFRPERFLDSAGRVQKNEHLVPYSLGKRQCLGESLARAELFLFFTGLLQEYDVCPAGDSPPAEDHTYTLYFLFIMPKPFKVIFRQRRV